MARHHPTPLRFAVTLALIFALPSGPALASPGSNAGRTQTAELTSAAPASDVLRITELHHGEELIMPPPVRKKFGYSTSAPYWSAVAITDARDYDLSLYEDAQNTHLLARSNFKIGTEFVVVDSNRHHAPAPFYPTVTGDGTGPNYTIEIDTDDTTLRSAIPLQVPMTNRDLVAIQDTFLKAGGRYTFTVSANPDQNPSLYLMQSTDSEFSWYQGRRDAVAKARLAPIGKPERIKFTAPATGWYGLVLINVNGLGSGTYTIVRTGPKGL
jgi:hypothetical protein